MELLRHNLSSTRMPLILISLLLLSETLRPQLDPKQSEPTPTLPPVKLSPPKLGSGVDLNPYIPAIYKLRFISELNPQERAEWARVRREVMIDPENKELISKAREASTPEDRSKAIRACRNNLVLMAQRKLPDRLFRKLLNLSKPSVPEGYGQFDP